MNVTNVTLFIGIAFLSGGFIELYNHASGTAVSFFKDYPLAIALIFVAGAPFIVGYFLLRTGQNATLLLIAAVAFIFFLGATLSLYNAYVGFGSRLDMMLSVVPILLLNAGLAVWYVRALLSHAKHDT